MDQWITCFTDSGVDPAYTAKQLPAKSRAASADNAVTKSSGEKAKPATMNTSVDLPAEDQ